MLQPVIALLKVEEIKLVQLCGVSLEEKLALYPGYKYSKAMAAHGKNWSFEEMNGFLIKPKDWIKGTKMSFAGLKNAKDRADVIRYMNENTNSPVTASINVYLRHH